MVKKGKCSPSARLGIDSAGLMVAQAAADVLLFLVSLGGLMLPVPVSSAQSSGASVLMPLS